MGRMIAMNLTAESERAMEETALLTDQSPTEAANEALQIHGRLCRAAYAAGARSQPVRFETHLLDETTFEIVVSRKADRGVVAVLMANDVNDALFHCGLCPEVVSGITASMDHLRLMHPEQYGDGPERWPDGGLVVDDQTLDPKDFS